MPLPHVRSNAGGTVRVVRIVTALMFKAVRFDYQVTLGLCPSRNVLVLVSFLHGYMRYTLWFVKARFLWIWIPELCIIFRNGYWRLFRNVMKIRIARVVAAG